MASTTACFRRPRFAAPVSGTQRHAPGATVRSPVPTILGISAYYHDSAACLLRDGEIVAAVQEERFSRVKHDHRFPTHAVQACLREGGIGVDGLDCVAFYDKPFLKFDRILETHLALSLIHI